MPPQGCACPVAAACVVWGQQGDSAAAHLLAQLSQVDPLPWIAIALLQRSCGPVVEPHG